MEALLSRRGTHPGHGGGDHRSSLVAGGVAGLRGAAFGDTQMAREEAEVAAGGRACSLTTVKWGTTLRRGGKEYHEKDTTTVHHDGSGATFGCRDGLGGSPRSDNFEYGSGHHRGTRTPPQRGHHRQHHGAVLRDDEHEELPDPQPLHNHSTFY